MPLVHDVAAFLDSFAPRALADDWDNVGLLVGGRDLPATRIMTCLTLTPDVAAEAIDQKCELVVTHHPVLFRAVKRLTTDTIEGTMLLNLVRAGVSVYSPHTGYDSAARGINQQLAERLGLQGIRPLRHTAAMRGGEAEVDVAVGGGRFGALPAPTTFREFLALVKSTFCPGPLAYVGDPNQTLNTVAVACGSAAEFLPDAQRADCDALVLGEARFHACLEARSEGIAMVLLGHYASERPALEKLAEALQRQFPDATVWASRRETDPVEYLI